LLSIEQSQALVKAGVQSTHYRSGDMHCEHGKELKSGNEFCELAEFFFSVRENSANSLQIFTAARHEIYFHDDKQDIS
jgi:hypothetical protein